LNLYKQKLTSQRLLIDKLILDGFRSTLYRTNVYALTGLTFGGLWTGIEDHTTWTLIFIDYSTCTTQLDRSGHVSSTCLAQLERSGHVSSTCLAPSDCPSQESSAINVASSLSSRCPSNIVFFLRASHNVPRVLHEQMT